MFPRHDHRAARRRPRCTAGAWSPAASRRTASRSCSRSPAATCSRSTTAAARRASTSSTCATSRPPRSPPRAGRRSRASRASARSPPGPGVTNGMSALGSAQQNHSPMLVLGGRAPAMRWGQGSLQEIDHVPFVRPLVKLAATAASTAEIPGLVDEALGRGAAPALRPDVPRLPARPRLHGGRGARAGRARPAPAGGAPDAAHARPRRRAAARRRAAGDHGRHQPLLGPRRGRAARARRGASASRCSSTGSRAAACPPTTRCSSRARAAPALKGADVALVVGVPMDFRLGFGAGVRRGLRADRARRRRARARAPARGRRRALRRPRRARCARSPAPRPAAAPTERLDRRTCAASRTRSAPREREQLDDERAPLHPLRVYKELGEVLDRDAIVICDGGDFASYAGPRDRVLRAGLLARPGAVRLPRLRAGLRARGQARAPGPPGRAAARRRRVRLLRAWSGTRSPATASASSA